MIKPNLENKKKLLIIINEKIKKNQRNSPSVPFRKMKPNLEDIKNYYHKQKNPKKRKSKKLT